MKRLLPVILILVSACIRPASAQPTASEVLDNMAETWLSGIAAVDDYTVTATSFTSYHKKYTDTDGRPFFKVTTEDNFSGMNVGNMTTMLKADDWNELRNSIRDVAEYGGRANVRGINTHVVRLLDFSSFTLDTSSPGERPDSVLFYVDPEGWLLARIVIFGSKKLSQGSSAVTPMIDFEDYRDVGSMKVAFLTRVTMAGMQINITQAKVDEAQAGIVKLESRLASLPTAQREKMMQLIRPQIERMQEMVDSGTIETVFEVKKVEVNTGLPESMFN